MNTTEIVGGTPVIERAYPTGKRDHVSPGGTDPPIDIKCLPAHNYKLGHQLYCINVETKPPPNRHLN